MYFHTRDARSFPETSSLPSRISPALPLKSLPEYYFALVRYLGCCYLFCCRLGVVALVLLSGPG